MVESEQKPQHAVKSSLVTSHPPKSWTNPRKRPLLHDAFGLSEATTSDNAVREAETGGDLHASKRSRAAEWPLRNTHDIAPLLVPKFEEHHGKRSSSSSVRPSKFQEGSMNDRVSQRPPSLYTREEEAMERYVKNQEQDREEMDINYGAGIESDRSSGMFRFGKAIANAFKPFGVWPSMWKDKEKERSISPEKSVLQERQVKAAEAYTELKKSGFKGTQAYTHHETQSIPSIKEEAVGHEQAPPFRDSGIDMDYRRQSYEPDPNDQLIDFSEALLVPPLPKHRSASPFSNISSPRKPSLQFRKPSLQGLKKATSQIHLSPAKRQAEVPAVSSCATEHGLQSVSIGGSDLQRQPSRKDIAKYSKLSKKVSDLEDKLQHARRELELSVSTAPPVPDVPSHLTRKPFRPGILPSLPSERNMSPQKDILVRSNSNDENIPPKSDGSIGQIAHDADIFKASIGIHDVQDLETAKCKSKARKSSQSLENKAQAPTGVKKRLPRVPSNTPRNSPLRSNENLPPVPAAPANVVDPLRNDHHVGQNKVTDHTSVSHLDRAPSPFLGPPASASPIRTRSKTSRRGISPPPPSLSSARKSKPAPDAVPESKGEDKPFTVPTAIIDVDPIKPKLPQRTSQRLSMTALAQNDEKAPKPQSEDFEWDDDVF